MMKGQSSQDGCPSFLVVALFEYDSVRDEINLLKQIKLHEV